LLTNHGERLGRYDYGANLSIFLYDASGSTETEYRQGIINQITNKLTSAFSGIVITDLEVDLKFNNQKIETNTTLEQTTYHTRNFITNASAAGTETASGLAKVIILLTFAIPTLNLKNQKIETTLFVGG
jgi:hypothetical protein